MVSGVAMSVCVMSLINFLTRIHFADRVLEDALPVELARGKLARVLVIADAAGKAEQARLQTLLAAECSAYEMVMAPAGAAQGLPRGEAEAIIGFGGPRALLAAQMSARASRSRASLPVIAIPTTCASVGIFPPGHLGAAPGSEGGGVPTVVLCDPTLTLWAGASETISFAFEALSASIESYLSLAWNPPADGIALDGIARIAGHLGLAVERSADLVPRRELLAAALNAGLAAQKGRGAAAAIVNAVQQLGASDASAGRLSAAILPAVLRFNAPALNRRERALAAVLQSSACAAEALEAFFAHHIGAARLGDLGLAREDLAAIAQQALSDPQSGSNPRLICGADYLSILEASF